ncbi:hypothetical protein GGF37_002784 [Kickxella alabastrina]|nr:hypothetical protein GGF37_002784 [Kickxella alabastrina]
MDFLKAAISSEVKKRKSLYDKAAAAQGDTVGAEPAGVKRKKYVRAGDLSKAAAAAAEAKDKAPTAKPSPATASSQQQAVSTAEPTAHPSSISKDDSSAADSSMIRAEEVIKRLRARSEPIRLFGESDGARRRRLRQLELSEEKSDGQRNEFRRALAQVEAGAMLDDLRAHTKMHPEPSDRQLKYEQLMLHDVSDISPELLRSDADRLHSLLYMYFKRLVYEWDAYLADRPEDERRSAEGKMAAATQRQAAEYLKPLFRDLRVRRVPLDVLARIAEIARCMLDREYMRANDAYLQLSIGNAPWPLGVTQVGIHARAARENINANKVAHVLNDETQRKWIQSVKRLMRFAQTKYPPEDLAKMVG